ncbi:MAG: HAMP domain-containing protein [Nitrospirota bacterium]|nr:MAG: HAMP domain-containing protein [Nitrospirota bacterium]
MIINKLKTLSLGSKFSIAVTLLIILSMVGIASLIINYQKESLRQSTFENNLSMTRNLAKDSVEPLITFDPLRLDELVKTTLEATSSCIYSMIIDSEGQLVAHTNRSLLGTDLSSEHYPQIGTVLDEGDELIREYSYNGVQVKEFNVPIKIRSNVFGVATIAYSLKNIDLIIEERLWRLKKYIYLITAIMVFTGIAGALFVSNYLTTPLKKLKSKMLNIQSGELDVEVENEKLVKCWERLDCDKKDCPSYGKLRCWATAGTFCHGEVQGEFAQKIGDCRKCVVYKESCGDEITELVEVFNQMVKDLNYNLKELEKANDERSRMERLSALGEMATTVAHETKNPLNAIRIAASYLKNNFEGEILSEFLSIIEEEVKRLNDISSNFLSFSRPAPLKMKTCDLNAIVRPTVELIRQEATEKNVEIVMLTDENLPVVNCDLARIKQAILNLLINALDISREGDTITVTTEYEGPDVTISIKDTGPGMAADEVEKIFKPFYTTKTRGSGLGLAIVERIIKEHNGEIDVRTASNEGAEFIITLPVYDHAKV